MNLIPFYATASNDIKNVVSKFDENNKLNLTYINKLSENVCEIFVAWGIKNAFSEDFYNDRVNEVAKISKSKKVYCSGITTDGFPKNPSRGGWRCIPETSYPEYNLVIS